jgi:hypothetical protein
VVSSVTTIASRPADGVRGEPSHVEVRLSPGNDTSVHLDHEDRLPLLVIIAGPIEVTIAPGGVELGATDVAAADALADHAAMYAAAVRKLADRVHGENLVRGLAQTDRP